MPTPLLDSFGPDRWNACIELFLCPLEELDPVQRPAALVFRYYGLVMNGGHYSWFCCDEDELDDELLNALRMIAPEHSVILAEAIQRWRRMSPLSEQELDAEADTISRLDGWFYDLDPDLLERLAEYIDAHRESFPGCAVDPIER